MDSKNIIVVKNFKVLSNIKFQRKDKNYKIFEEKQFKENMKKWNMDAHFKLFSYHFQSELHIEDNELISDLLQNPEILQDLGWQSLIDSALNEGTDVRIELEKVPGTVQSMEFFYRLFERGVAIEDGTVRKCFEDYVGDIVVADQLRSMLLAEESDTLFGEEERREFLFRIFKHFCIGGELNQYEDNVKPYLAISKALYKDTMCIRKVGAFKTPTILSRIYKVVCYILDAAVVPTSKLHEQDFLYIIINSPLHEIIIMYHKW